MLTSLAPSNDAGNVRNVWFEDLIEGGPKSFGVKNRLYLGIFEKVDRGLELLLDPIGGKDSVAVVACAAKFRQMPSHPLDPRLICPRVPPPALSFPSLTTYSPPKPGGAPPPT